MIGAPGIGAAARNLFRTVLLVLSGALLAGCLQPFSEADVQMVEDRIPPVIEIAVPINLAEYQAAVTVAGTIHDHAITAGDLRGTVDTVRFEIENTTVTGEWHRDGSGSGLSFDPISGAFEVTVATADLTARTISLRLTAEDTNLNVSTVTRAMVRTDGPHFSGFELFAPEGSTTFTLLEPLGIRGTLSNSFVDSTGTDNVVSLSWRRGSWSGDIDFSTEPDEAGWYTVENTGTGGTGNRGYFRYHAGTCAVEVYIPRVSGVDASDRLDFQFRAEDRNGNISTHEVSVFGLEAPGGDLVVNPNGQYFSSAAADPRSTEILIEAFSETDRDRITTITFWFDGDLAEAVSIVVDPALWREEVLPGRTDASLVYPLVLTPDLEAEPAGLTKLFGGQYGAGGGSITMDIELIDDNLPGSPLSFSTTLDDDPVAPAISGVTVTAGGSRYAKVGDEVTVSFDIGSETQSGVAVPPALSFFGGAAYAELVDYATAPSSGLIGSYTARYVLVDANLPATSAAGEPVVDFSLSVADRVGNVREYVAGDEAALDNVKYYKGDPVLTVSDITTTNANPAWSNASDTITLVFALDDDRDPAVGYPAVRIAGSDTSPETVDVTRNGAEYTATYQLSAADPEAEIAYEITFQDAAAQSVTVPETPSGIMLDRTAPEAPTVVMGQDSINAATAGAVGFTINWTATDVVGYRYVFSDDTAAHDVDVEVAVVAGTTEATVSNVDLTGLDDGPITLTVTVKDSAENEGEYVNATLTKDTGIPDDPTVTGLGPINATTAGAVGFTISWTATDVVGYRYVFSDGVDVVEGSDTFAAGPTEATVSNVNLTGLDDGPITLTVTVKDGAENEGEYVNATLTKDTGIPDDPTVTGLGPINAATAGAVGFTINWTATDVVGYRYVFSDGVDDVEGSDTFAAGPTEVTVSNADLTGLDDGSITLTVTVKDSAENEGEYVNATLTKDTGIPDDPTVTGLGPINATTAGAVGFTINWTATDVVGYRYVFSDDTAAHDVDVEVAVVAGTTEATVSNVDLTGLDDGPITLTVTVKDSAENEGEYVDATLTKDTGIPDDPTVTGLGPINATNAGAVGFTIDWTATDVVGYRYVFSDGVDDVEGSDTFAAGPTEATVSNVDLTGLDDGPITLTVTVKDGAENEGEYVDATLTKDTGIPDDPTVTGLGPINATTAGAVGFTINWTATDVVGYRYVFSDGVDDVEGSDTFAAGPTEATVSNVDLTGLDDGSITLTVTVKDGAENEGEYVDATLTKDTGIPDDPTVTGLGPINATTAGAVGFTISWIATDVVGYRYVFSDGVDVVEGSDTFAAGPTEVTVSNVDLTGLDDGSITLTVTVKDGAENEGEYVDATLTKDTGIPDDPTVTGLGPINAATAGAVGFTINWTATDVVGYRYVFSDGVDDVEGSDTFAAGPTEATVSNVNLTGLDDGPITLTVTVKDGAENEGEYVNATLTKDTGIPDDPTVTGLGPINATTAGAVGFTINWTATDVVGYRYVFSDGVDDVEGSDTFAAGPTEATVSNVNLTGLDDGPITLTVTVKDGAENEGEYVNATLTKDTGIPDDPTVTGLGPINAATAGAVGFTINWTATDVDGYRYVFSDGVDDVEGSDTFAAGPTEVTVSNADLTGLDDGSITLTVTVKDSAENEGEYVNATLTKDTGIPDDPTVTGLGPINAATAGAVGFTINWTATDVVGYRYVFSDGVDDVEGSDTFAAGPTEVTVSNADLTGLDDGSITLTVTVKDGAENEGEYVDATLTKDTTVIGVSLVGYAGGAAATSLSDDTITWTNSSDEESDTLTYYAVLAKGTTTTVTTVQTTYLAAGALTTDTSSPEKKAVSVASSDDAVGESAGNSIAFSNDLFNYAFIDDAHQSGKTAIAIGDTVQIFVVTVDVVGNVAVTEGATTETLTSISNAPPISTGGLIRGGIVPTGAGAGDTGDGWFRARGARSSRAAVQSALNPASVTARRGAATVPEGLTGTTTPPPSTTPAAERQDSSAPPAPAAEPILPAEAVGTRAVPEATPIPGVVGEGDAQQTHLVASRSSAGSSDERTRPGVVVSSNQESIEVAQEVDWRTLVMLWGVATVALIGLAVMYLARRLDGPRR